MIEPGAVQDLVARWWWNYDEGNFDVLACCSPRTHTFRAAPTAAPPTTRNSSAADVTGRDAVMGWQTDHRLNSPYPLRHNGSNIHVVAENGEEASFRSYILVTAIEGGVVVQSTALVSGPFDGTERHCCLLNSRWCSTPTSPCCSVTADDRRLDPRYEGLLDVTRELSAQGYDAV